MYCPNCKNKILEGKATCHFCGQDLSKMRKVRLGDAEEEETFSNVNLDRGQIRAALTYDPFKEKIKIHLLISSLMVIGSIGALIITFFSIGLFNGTFSTVVTVIVIIVFGIGFIYAVISAILFAR